MEASLTFQDFTQQLNTKFQIPVNESQRVELELAEISELKKTSRNEEFAIVFRGPKEAFLGQGMRPLEHDQLGKFDLFIVPIREDEKGYYYQAVFNRFLE
ncbi:MAG TPA: hypothetical protein VKC61_04815 [Pyrinomonadaceae bacterium]|nr:hypothetical protein [Pyrinomonadaceae bacterium]